MRARLLIGSLLVPTAFTPFVSAQGSKTKSPAKSSAKPATKPAATKDVTATVFYTGKGTVDAAHSIMLFLFADPNIGPSSHPVGIPEKVTHTGAKVTFKDPGAAPVYVLAVYNDKGTSDGSTVPPAGTPVGIYSDPKGKPLAVTPGPKGVITLKFDGSKKFGQ